MRRPRPLSFHEQVSDSFILEPLLLALQTYENPSFGFSDSLARFPGRGMRGGRARSRARPPCSLAQPFDISGHKPSASAEKSLSIRSCQYTRMVIQYCTTEPAFIGYWLLVIRSALVRTHQSTYYGSFGPVLPPGWVWLRRLHPLGSRASRCGGAHPTSARDAMPTSSPGSRCCIIKPLLAVG